MCKNGVARREKGKKFKEKGNRKGGNENKAKGGRRHR